jgi:hypothetical protein
MKAINLTLNERQIFTEQSVRYKDCTGRRFAVAWSCPESLEPVIKRLKNTLKWEILKGRIPKRGGSNIENTVHLQLPFVQVSRQLERGQAGRGGPYN